jgi:hypothetical protein
LCGRSAEPGPSQGENNLGPRRMDSRQCLIPTKIGIKRQAPDHVACCAWLIPLGWRIYYYCSARCAVSAHKCRLRFAPAMAAWLGRAKCHARQPRHLAEGVGRHPTKRC